MKFSSRIWLCLILLAGFVIRIYRLGASSLWYDETVSVFLARQDLISLTRHTAGDIHPPLYYYLLHFWGLVAGWSEFSAAFLSLFFGVLLVALVYRVSREWLTSHLVPLPSPRSGQALKTQGDIPLLAAFLVTISPYNLWYSQEVRMYTLGATLGLASVYFFVRMLDASRNSKFKTRNSRLATARGVAAYAIVSAAGMYTLYYFAFLIAFQNLIALAWLIKLKIKNGTWFTYNLQTWVLSQVAVLLLYLPWLPIAFRQATDPPVPPWRTFTPLINVLLESFSALALGQSTDVGVSVPILLIVGMLLFVALMSYQKWNIGGQGRKNEGGIRKTEGRQTISPVFLFGYTVIPLLIIYALSFWKPLYHVRYIFTYSPGFYILLALGIVKIANYRGSTSRGLVTAGILILLTAVFACSAYNFWFNPQYAHDDLRGAVKQISERWRPGDAILVNAGYTYPALVYYFDQPIEWRGRLTNYPPTNVSSETIQRLVNQRAEAIVLQIGSINGGANLGWGNPESDFYATTAEETRAALDRVFASHPRIWILRLYDTVVDSDGIIRDYLAQHGRLIHDQVFSGEANARAQGYLTSQTPLTTLPPGVTLRQVLLGNRIALVGFEPAELAVHSGEAVDMNLYWRANEATNVDMRVFVGLFTEDGKLVTSTSEQPLGNGLGTSRWGSDEIMREPVRLIAPNNISPGNYWVRIAMYNPFTNEPLEAEKSEWVTQASQIRIAKVRIE